MGTTTALGHNVTVDRMSDLSLQLSPHTNEPRPQARYWNFTNLAQRKAVAQTSMPFSTVQIHSMYWEAALLSPPTHPWLVLKLVYIPWEINGCKTRTGDKRHLRENSLTWKICRRSTYTSSKNQRESRVAWHWVQWGCRSDLVLKSIRCDYWWKDLPMQ